MTRREKVRKAQRLRKQGLKLWEIGAQMGGYSPRTVGAWLSDPDRSKEIARKRSYGGTCKDCGARTDGSNGPGKAPDYCKLCAPAQNTYWTEDRVIEAIENWIDLYEDLPTAEDWNPAMVENRNSPRAPEVRRRFDAGYWPYTTTVIEVFGSWNAGMEAAGYTPRGVGKRGPDRIVHRKRKAVAA